MNATVSYTRAGPLALLRIANPPVNALSQAVIEGLSQAVQAFADDADAQALVIACAGRTFVAGGDITAFDAPDFSARPFNTLLARLEALDRPVVAALHGTALGGGMELALAAHYRIAHSTTQLGFPEVKLGLLPGSLGTQRLPRLIGTERALAMITDGQSIGAAQALNWGLLDAVSAEEPEAAGLKYAQSLLDSQAPVRPSSARSLPAGDGAASLQQAAEQAQRKGRYYPALPAIVEAVQAAGLPFAQGEAVEARLFEALRASPQSRALRHLFFAQRQAARVPGLAKDLVLRAVQHVGVLGAGTMGRGIAINFLNVGLPVLLVEQSAQALQAAVEAIRQIYQANVAKGRLTAAALEQRMGLLSGAVNESALANCDLVIEAVFEDMALKKVVCARLGAICKPGAIIATNTSTLDVDALAVATGRPQDVVGMHFFSPAHVMKLLEVVRGAQTDPVVLATVMQLARSIGKVAVVSGVCYGFIGNRMAEVYMREAEFLIMEGASPSQVDAAVEDLGMAMGPCRMLDLAGIDVGAKTVIEYGKAGGLPPDASYRALVRRLFEGGQFGQKTGLGYYRYEGRKASPNPAVDALACELAQTHGIVRRNDIGREEITERLLYPLINEGARILEEGIAYRPADIDVVWTCGYGFPDHVGGPIFMADQIGLPRIAQRLAHYAQTRGNAYGYWSMSPLLQSLAEQGRRLSDWKAPA
ncbi:MAG: 3-hydroxyacyl-CoA dehydrogenase NAD-binding domain-containing protein [Betaproteobacteria bacterium]